MKAEIKIKQYLNKSWLWVRLSAELDMAVADTFRDTLSNAMASSGCRNLWLDFSRVSFIDSSGLGVLLGRYRQLQPLGGKILITNPHEQVYRLLVASGLHRIMEIEQPQSYRLRREGS